MEAVDGTGTIQPLASQAAAKIIAKGDPIWCPTGQKPGSPLCTPAEATVTALIGDLASKSGAGTVYFTSTYSVNDATFVQGSMPGLTDLTIQGGWNGKVKGFKVSGATTFSVPLSILNWIGNVTINNVNISGASSDGLSVTTKGNIKVHQVTSNNNSGDGAFLDNTLGTGNISVDTSTFNNNTGGGDGLFAVSNGAITLTTVTANSNPGGDGVFLDNSGGTGAISVKSSTFNSNPGGDGLFATSKGAITLNKVTANSNPGGDGAFLGNSSGTGAISVSSSTFNSNTGGDGLYASSNGALTLNKVTADSNQDNGAELYNNGSGATGAISVSSSAFNGSTAADGLYAFSNGAITLNTVTADSNYDYGAYLKNNYTGASNVSISKSNFKSNITSLNGTKAGLYIYSNGNVSLLSISASNNLGGDGTDVYGSTSTSLMVSNSTFNNNYSSVLGWGEGLYADQVGNVTLSKVTANSNHSAGAALYTTGAVSVSSSIFNGTTGSSVGLYVSTNGAITLNKVTANVNAEYGAELISGTGAITVTSSTFNGDIGGDGLYAAATGAIMLSKVTASGNAGDGVDATSTNVLVSCSNISHNGGYGIYATLGSLGTLTLNKVTLIGNSVPYLLSGGLGNVVTNTHC